MPYSGILSSRTQGIALVGNHLPRQCGIATFTADLLAALDEEESEAQCWAVVMNDRPEGYRYPPKVRFEINQRVLSDYRLAADFLNMTQVEAVCVQHEYGIFGGDYGSHVLELLTNLRMPVITTLHTVLDKPSAGQKAVMKGIVQVSDRLVVMSNRAREILREVYGVPDEKAVLIHHGIPDVPFVDPNYYKDQFGVEGRKVILTFGLLSPGKGIEYMIDALPAVVEKHPEAVYIVLGATHPHIRKEKGEEYRISLQSRARSLGVGGHVIFHNRFVDIKELCEFLGAADVYVTPYLGREQVTSGTLAYALGTGKATVSTPYWYAEEMLADDRGRLVPFRDAEALAAEVSDLFSNEVERHAMRKRAYNFCRDMVWKEVARRYLDLIAQVRRERERKPRVLFNTGAMRSLSREIPQPNLDHVLRLTDNVGILQHARNMVPDRSHGYCTDDNARALIAVLMAGKVSADSDKLIDLACTYLGFLLHAFNQETGRFRNFMGYDRRWMEQEGSEDSHGRALWGLGEAVSLGPVEQITAAALHLFETALPAALSFKFPRAWAFVLVGIHAYLRRFSGDSEVRRVREKLAGRLFKMYKQNASESWPWIEEKLTYGNGKIPHALILSGQWMQDGDMLACGLRSLEWLMEVQTDSKGHFVPVGNHGWFPRGGEKARFDQQPIEAMDMIEACREAYNATGDAEWVARAQTCLEWFLGRNDLDVPLYDYRTAGCCDGLTAQGPNLNQGAESTLAWLLSLLHVHQLRSARVLNETSEGLAEEPEATHAA